MHSNLNTNLANFHFFFLSFFPHSCTVHFDLLILLLLQLTHNNFVLKH